MRYIYVYFFIDFRQVYFGYVSEIQKGFFVISIPLSFYSNSIFFNLTKDFFKFICLINYRKVILKV